MALRVAMLGLGVISRFYLDALPRLEELELVAVCDRDERRLAPHAAAGVACDRDWRATLARPEVDAVLVNLPNDLHAEVCAAALRAGRHVCCEKPLTLSVDQSAELVELARAGGRTLFTAFHRRYNAHLERWLARGGAARVVRARARYDELIAEHVGDDAWYLDPARCGGGCLADNGPNAFDALRAVLGPLEVVAASVERDGRGVDLRARVELRAATGVPAIVELDWDYREGERKDLLLELDDGRVEHVDFLAGYEAFKSSLAHEYVGVLRDFAARVAAGDDVADDGAEIVRMVARAYALAGAEHAAAR